MKNIGKLIVSKSMKYKKTRTPFCFYCYLLRVNVKKNIEKTLFVRAGVQKR